LVQVRADAAGQAAPPAAASAAAFEDLARLAGMAAEAAAGWVVLAPDAGQGDSVVFSSDPAAAGLVTERVAELAREVAERGRTVLNLDAGVDERRPDASGAVVDGRVGSWGGVPLRTGDGRILGAVCVADRQPRADLSGTHVAGLEAVARLVVAQLELDEAQQLQDSILRAAGQVWFRTDADGLLLAVSPSWTALTGLPAAHCCGRSLSELMSTADQARVRSLLQHAPAGPSRPIEVSLTRRGGDVLPVELAVGPLLADGGVVLPGAVGVLTDLRDRRQREMQEGHDQKLEALGRLSAGIAHEINTPIQFVGDNTRFLAEAYDDMIQLLTAYRTCLDESNGALPWEERQGRIAAAEQAADIDYLSAEVPSAVAQSLEGIDRVASLVQAMKAFSYKDSVERSYADLNEALETTLAVARNETKYVADVILDLQEIPPVLCHVGDLNQVFLNLLVNAADALRDKADAEGGRGEIRVGTALDGEDVVVTVADNGGGIPQAIQDKIFEPFFTTKDVGKGTGQGLALARSVVQDKHGGTITLVSGPGEGTCFVLRLPVVGPKPAR
jgi:two-component system NtrC family sensor kinase